MRRAAVPAYPRFASRALIAVGALLAGAAIAAAAGAAEAPGEESLQLKEGPGREMLSQRCAICHSLDYIPSNAPALDRAGWQKTIQKMRDRFGAPVTDDEARQILEYLAANYSGKP
jgi:mono/diheme cytochrome c family protein